MAIMRFKKGDKLWLSQSFKATEFDCKCDSPDCTDTVIDSDLIGLLQVLRQAIRLPITIHEGYRCHAYQKHLKEAGWETSIGVSQHELGRAVDIIASGMSGPKLEIAARAVGVQAVGVAATWIHMDLRIGKERRWFYTKRPH